MTEISIRRGDITQSSTEAIVNAANSSLMGGGGVDGAIHRAGGPEILEECKKIISRIGSCQPGEAVITTGGKLPSKYVIHTVGPIWNGGHQKEEEKLSNCYQNSLRLAVEYQCQSISFPNISTGIYRFPKEKAAEIAIKAVKEFLVKSSSVKLIKFVCFDRENYDIYRKMLN